MRRYLGIAASIGLAAMEVFTSFGSARAACEGSSVQFADDFSHPDSSWGPFNNEVFRDKKYIMTVEPNGTEADWPSAALFSGTYTVCVHIKLPSDPKSAAGSGVLFWIEPEKNKREGHNYYMAMMSPDGFYWISRQIDGVLSTVFEPVQSDLVKTELNAVNEIAVELRDNRGVLIINNKKAGEFVGQPPSQSHAGILSGAPLDKKHQIEFSNFRVVKP
jgi:hypothetical protein